MIHFRPSTKSLGEGPADLKSLGTHYLTGKNELSSFCNSSCEMMGRFLEGQIEKVTTGKDKQKP
jgi:hypothetical protein